MSNVFSVAAVRAPESTSRALAVYRPDCGPVPVVLVPWMTLLVTRWVVNCESVLIQMILKPMPALMYRRPTVAVELSMVTSSARPMMR